MFIKARCLILLSLLLCVVGVSAQQQAPPAQQPAPSAQPGASSIVLDVVVTPKSGPAEGGLEQKDFTLLDNKVPQTITSFQAIDGRNATVRVVLLIDAVNAPYSVVSFERDQIDKFLRADEGHLAHPTVLAVLSDTGLQLLGSVSTDGNTLSASLDKFTVSLRDVTAAAGIWGASERWQYSLDGLRVLAKHEASAPERKIILCISPGWPLLSGPQLELQLDEKQRQERYNEIAAISTQLREASITLYSVDPYGSGDAASSRLSYWENFRKGVSKPGQVEMGDFALPVIATQSGGAAVTSSNDITALLRQCISDTRAYYELSFDPPKGERPNTYHQLEVRVAKPGLTARTRQSYYSQH
jgi:VWFA-related protein